MKRGYGCLITNLLTMVMVLATCGFVSYVVVLVANPYLGINAFPPLLLPTIIVLPSATATTLIPTFSTFPTLPSTFTVTPTITNTRPPTNTPAAVTPTDTPIPVSDTPAATATVDATQIAQLTEQVPTNTPPPTNTSAPTFTPTKTQSAFPFTVQGGIPIPQPNFANSAGCNWMGIGGQAFNLEGNPIIGLVVHLEGGGLNQDAITGTKSAYGTGGYEFFLNNRPVQSSGEYKVQLRDQNGNIPFSDFITVNTFADCNKNLLLVNFVQNH